MLKNYLRIALRNFWKNKTFSAINIFGLTIGLTSCLLIALYIRNELSYDQFQGKGDRIARVIMEYRFDGSGSSNKGNFTSTKVAPTFKRTFPEIVSAVRMSNSRQIVGYKDKLFRESNFMYADSTFFKVFDHHLLEGDQNTALSGLYKIVLSQSTARKYFGNEDPVGKTLRISADSINYQVTGVMADYPSNSQIKFNFLASFSSLNANQEDTYWNANYTTYLLLQNPGSIASLQAKLHPFMQGEMKGKGATVDFYLEPFTWIHLHSEYGGFEPNNSISYIYILGAVALLILIIAGSTYINLSTARSIERAREVGVRKVIGAGKGQLFWQFIGESMLVCLISVILSLAIAFLALPWFNQVTDKELTAASLFSLPFLSFAFLVAAAVSLLAGSYPAMILAGFQPVKVLKGSFKNTRSGQGLRKSLIVFQFIISVFLIVSTFVMQNQLHYIQNKKLGYDREHVLVLPMSNKLLAELSAIKGEFRSDPDILSISRCVSTPVNIAGGYNMRSAAMPENEQMAVTANPVDEDYIRTTGLELVAGEGLSAQDVKDVASDDPDARKNRFFHFVLNESAARQLGWTPEQAVGKRMFLDNSRPGLVKGVVKDFHFESLHHAIRPLVLFPEVRGYGSLLVKLSGQHVQQSVSFIERKWKEMV
ncbi:MAG TPA: ABC transporter permease, partial [Puia sp.]|nr:ABC transporter permease [Puia sp.]